MSIPAELDEAINAIISPEEFYKVDENSKIKMLDLCKEAQLTYKNAKKDFWFINLEFRKDEIKWLLNILSDKKWVSTNQGCAYTFTKET